MKKLFNFLNPFLPLKDIEKELINMCLTVYESNENPKPIKSIMSTCYPDGTKVIYK